MTINLTAPDPEFKYKLAVPHAVILPANSPPKDSGTKLIPGTGPYMFSTYNPNRQLTMVRNPYFKQWSKAAQPAGYPDRITYSFGLTVEAQITAIQNDQADWTLEAPPADRLGELGRKYAKQVHITPLTAFWYVPMNTRLAPFNKLKARQAVNYAIDRRATVNLFGGPNLATPSCQVLPPGFPGHKDYCPYTKNPGQHWSAPTSRRRSVWSRSRARPGQKVVVITPDDEVNKDMGVYLQSVLKRSATRRASSRSPGTSSSPTSRTRRTRSRSTCSSGTRTTRRRRTSSTSCSAASPSTPAATRASTSPGSATRRSTTACTMRSTSA